MRTENEIIQAIKSSDRTNMVYIHPTLSSEKAAKYISAFSNGSGGEIILGIDDDGRTLRIKNHSVPFKLDNALKLLNKNVNCEVRSFQYDRKKLSYISIEKSSSLVTVDNKAYVINPNGELLEMRTKKVFLSYCHADSDLATIVEKRFIQHKDVDVSRDINITKYKDDLDEFMKTIRSHDYVVSIVTRKYLESLNCMYEISELMKDPHFDDKLLFIIVDEKDANYYEEENAYKDFEAGIYKFSKRVSYIKYWDTRQKKMEMEIKEANLPYEMVAEFALEKRKLVSVISSTNEFMNLLQNKVGRSFNSVEKNDFEELIDIIRK